MDVFPLTKELYQGCTNFIYRERRIQFAGKDSIFESYSTNYLFASDDSDILEIMIFKNTIIKLFNECRPILKEYLSKKEIVDFGDPNQLVKYYYTTVGLLICTHENRSVINLHYDIINKILSNKDPFFGDLLLDSRKFIIKELFFLQSLLNSNSNKLNKSSSLWTLFKRLYIFVIDNNIKSLPESFFLQTAIKAAELHFSNYYAWNFIRFLFNISKLTGDYSKYIDILKQVQNFAYCHHSDSSAWTGFTDCFNDSQASLNEICFEFNRYSKEFKIDSNLKNNLVMDINCKDQLKTLSNWLWEKKTVSEVPYYAFRRLIVYNVKVLDNKELVSELMSTAKINYEFFRELKLKPKSIVIENNTNYLITNFDVESDYALGELLKIYFNWKHLIDWYEMFILGKYITIPKLE